MATEQEQIEKAALEYANQIVLEAQDSPEYFAFINGVEWQKEQSANDAIGFGKWIIRQKFGHLAGKSYKELYREYQKTKNNADN